MKHRKLLKTLTAIVLVLVLSFTFIANAFAGSILNTLKNAAKTCWNGLKTAGIAVYDTGKYLVTDQDAEKAYSGTVEAAKETKKKALDTADSAVQIGKDAVDVYEGAKKVLTGAKDLLEENPPARDVINFFTGDGPVREETEQAMQKMKDGYKQMDNDLILDTVKLIPGYGTFIAAGADMVKSGVEYAAGYIDKDGLEKSMVDDLIDAGMGVVTGGAGTLVENTAGKVGIKLAGEAAKTEIKDAVH